MADIFISYSKSERDVTEALARDLKAAGYSVWWDTGLVAGDVYKDVILREIAAAKAAIVIWTKSSVGSEWVYSEANRAHAKRKLIPLRTANIAVEDIPPPFDALHTELVTNRPAVLASLAKFGVTAPAGAEAGPAVGTEGIVGNAATRGRAGVGRLGRAWVWMAKRPILSLSAGLAVLALIAITLIGRQSGHNRVNPFDELIVASPNSGPPPSPVAASPSSERASTTPANNAPVSSAPPAREADTNETINMESSTPAQKAADLLASARSNDESALADLRGDMSSYDDEIRTELQRILANDGFYKGDLDGVWGAGSRAAFEDYLKAQ